MAEHEFLIAAMGWANWAYSKRYNAKTDSKPTEVNKTISIEEIGKSCSCDMLGSDS